MNTFRKDLGLGISTWFKAWKFVFDHNLLHYFLYPIAASILMGMGAVVLIKKGVDSVETWVSPHLEYTPLGDGGFWSKILEFLSDIRGYAIALALWIVFLYIYRKAQKYLLLAIMSPMMALLSERTDEILTGQVYPFDGQQFVRDVLRGVLLAFRNFFLETMIGIVIWIVSIVLTYFTGGIGVVLLPVTLVASFIVSAYFYGFATMDYTNERKRRSIGESIKYIRARRGIALGNGGVFYGIMLLPIIGPTIAMVTCTVAATLAMHETDKENR
ncbi:MAG: EI24 domain-containing protein [Flavobacteriales bacterium]